MRDLAVNKSLTFGGNKSAIDGHQNSGVHDVWISLWILWIDVVQRLPTVCVSCLNTPLRQRMKFMNHQCGLFVRIKNPHWIMKAIMNRSHISGSTNRSQPVMISWTHGVGPVTVEATPGYASYPRGSSRHGTRFQRMVSQWPAVRRGCDTREVWLTWAMSKIWLECRHGYDPSSLPLPFGNQTWLQNGAPFHCQLPWITRW